MIKIWNFGRSVRGLRVFWLCEEMGLDYQVEVIGFPPDESYRARNPLGGVPFLEDGGVAINESVAMLLYLAGKYGPTPLLPSSDTPEYARVLQLTVLSEASLGGGINTLLGALFVAPEAEKRNWSVGFQEQRLVRSFEVLADMLGERPYLAGENFTIADIAIATTMGMWTGPLKQSVRPNLERYRARLFEREAYKRAARHIG